jgi:ubiquinone biosynthesis protein UbiJ
VTSPDTLARVEHACAVLRQAAKPVTFTSVAAQAGISRTSLYRDPSLRAIVDEHRTAVVDPRTLTGLTSEVGHLRTAVEALAERVRRHEEQLRRLERDRRPRRKAN